MEMRFVAAAILTIIGVAGCSSPPPPPPRPAGALPSGTAQVTVNGQDTGTIHDVVCQSSESMTTITIGTDRHETTVIVDNAEALTAKSVAVDNVGGFTGSYWQDLQGSAQIGMVGQTYTITGTADGFNTDNPAARTTGNFTVKAAC